MKNNLSKKTVTWGNAEGVARNIGKIILCVAVPFMIGNVFRYYHSDTRTDAKIIDRFLLKKSSQVQEEPYYLEDTYTTGYLPCKGIKGVKINFLKNEYGNSAILINSPDSFHLIDFRPYDGIIDRGVISPRRGKSLQNISLQGVYEKALKCAKNYMVTNAESF